VDRLNYKRGITRIAIVAHVALNMYLIFALAGTPVGERPGVAVIFVEFLGAGVMVAMGAYALLIAWWVVAW
jgi:hypothetical protein